MKREFLIQALLCLLFCMPANSQVDLRDFDSIFISKPMVGSLTYKLSHPVYQNVQLKVKFPHKLKGQSAFLGGLTRTLLASTIGGEWGGGGEGQLTISGDLYNGDKLEWMSRMYVNGKIDKTLSREQDDMGDGKHIETNKRGTLNWHAGDAWGNIREGNEIIGQFAITTNPLGDEGLISAYNKHVKEDPDSVVAMQRRKEKFLQWQEKMGLMTPEYGLIGEFRGKLLAIIYYHSTREGFVIQDEKLKAIFSMDDEEQGDILRSRKNRIPPALWISKSVSAEEQADIIRLALFCKLFGEIVSTGSYSF
ncbi:MAG TPA: hypothetical protein VFX73_11210 [Chitinophagaceae bacterium]|nr:hypothetical protein [Chitinophagaceae bacterium]